MFAVFIVVMLIILVCFITNAKNNENDSVRKIDKVGMLFNIILSIIYVPMSFVGMLGIMMSDGIISTTNQLYANLISIFCYISMATPILCIAGIILSIMLRKRGKSILAFFIQFMPLIIFLLDLLFLYIIDKFYR